MRPWPATFPGLPLGPTGCRALLPAACSPPAQPRCTRRCAPSTTASWNRHAISCRADASGSLPGTLVSAPALASLVCGEERAHRDIDDVQDARVVRRTGEIEQH